MTPVRQNDKPLKGWTERTARATAAAVLVLAGLAVAGCTQEEPVEFERRQASGQVPLQAPPDHALDAAVRLTAQRARVAAAAKRWGLARPPLPAPPPPARKPHITPRKGFEVDGQQALGLPPVFTTIPTQRKIVFLTIDDGAEKDPAFLQMMNDLKIPFTAFLSNYLVKDDYSYFANMQEAGVGLNNHTLHHPFLPGLSYAAQKREICGMQNIIAKRFGKRPVLFRPPYGDYNQDTLKAAKSCGVKYAPIWNEEIFVDRMEYREWDRALHPGDIILTHFQGRRQWNGTMPDMIRTFMDHVTSKRYAVARLEDYL